jgi:integrase/recombinase XerD
MSTSPEATFDRNYARHLQHLTLKGLQPKTIEAYSRAIRRIGERFDHQIDALSEQQLLDYFTELVASHSWSTVKLDLYGLEVLLRPCLAQTLGGARSDQATQEASACPTSSRSRRPSGCSPRTRVCSATGCSTSRSTAWDYVSAKGYGCRSAISTRAHGHVHIRNAKGNQDRLVPLPQATHQLLRRFWQVHRNPVLLFPSRHDGLKGAATATTPMDPGGVQTTLHRVVEACGLKKRSPPTAFAIRTRPT